LNLLEAFFDTLEGITFDLNPHAMSGVTSLGGAQMFTGGAGKNARQVIMNADGSTVIDAFNVAKKTYEHVTTITPKVP